MPCSIGNVCNCDTVDDSVHSHVNQKTTNTQVLLRQIQMNSDEKGSGTEFGRKRFLHSRTHTNINMDTHSDKCEHMIQQTHQVQEC